MHLIDVKITNLWSLEKVNLSQVNSVNVLVCLE